MKQKIELKFERILLAPPTEVFEAWLNPHISGTPWYAAEKLMFKPRVDEVFCLMMGHPHQTRYYGRFIEINPPSRIQHTWVSPYTLGEESTVTVTFEKNGAGTLMTLVHSDIPDTEDGRSHEIGWNHFLGLFPEQFRDAPHKNSYTATIKLAKSAKEVFDHIRDVSEWWSKDFEGQSVRLGDEFIIEHPGAHYSKQKLIELIPDKKVVWLVTESHLNWLEKNKDEWTGTRMSFEIDPKSDFTELTFTHQGLTPEKECYSRCSEGWDFVIYERLFNFIADD